MNLKVKRFLEIRQALSRSANAKYQAMQNYACTDNRARGTMLFHGAATGRWAGRGIQPHNMIRKSYANIEDLVGLIRNKDIAGITMLYDELFETLATATRGMIMAAPDYEFFCGDFRAIEGRILAWLAGENHILYDYVAGRDPYIRAAANVLGIEYDEVTEEQRQKPGKIAELACGYQGSVGAARQFGAEGDDQEILDTIIKPWRANRPATVAYWYGMEDAAKKAVENPGTTVKYGKVMWGLAKGFLYCQLPSSRLLSYYDPEIREKKQPWGKTALVLTYMGMKVVDGKTTTQWARVSTYGGKLVENVTQAVACDILALAIVELNKARYPIVMHVHDEVLAEPLKGQRDLDEFLGIMKSINPPWVEGLPLDADGWQGQRYKKG